MPLPVGVAVPLTTVPVGEMVPMLPVKARFCFKGSASKQVKERVDSGRNPASLQRREVDWRQHSAGLGSTRGMRPPGAMRRVDALFLGGLQQKKDREFRW